MVLHIDGLSTDSTNSMQQNSLKWNGQLVPRKNYLMRSPSSKEDFLRQHKVKDASPPTKGGVFTTAGTIIFKFLS